MDVLADSRLYSDTAHCLAFARRIEATSTSATKRTPFHFYWHGDFNRKTALALKSFLATQNLERAEAWLWLDAETPDECSKVAQYLGPLVSHIQVKSYDPESESRGSPFEGASDLLHATKLAARSDAFRFLILYTYGGLYIDIDTLFLRDFGPLLDSEFGSLPFVYRWSAEAYANSAIMCLNRHSALAQDLMWHCRRIKSCHPLRALRYQDHVGRNLRELPCAFFDPLWLHFDKRDHYAAAPFNDFAHFFRPFGLFFRRKQHIKTLADFFPGAFTYHWHNRWRDNEQADSYFGIFEQEIEDRLGRKLGGGTAANLRRRTLDNA